WDWSHYPSVNILRGFFSGRIAPNIPDPECEVPVSKTAYFQAAFTGRVNCFGLGSFGPWGTVKFVLRGRSLDYRIETVSATGTYLGWIGNYLTIFDCQT